MQRTRASENSKPKLHHKGEGRKQNLHPAL